MIQSGSPPDRGGCCAAFLAPESGDCVSGLLIAKRRRLRSSGSTGLVALLILWVALIPQSASAATDCDLPSGQLAVTDLPTGSSVLECDAVGRLIVGEDGQGVTIPKPGWGVSAAAIGEDGADIDFGVKVDADGAISYPEPIVEGSSAAGEETASAAAALNECDDTSYAKEGWKEEGTFEWHIYSGISLAGMSQDSIKSAIVAAFNAQKNSVNNCNYDDQVSASSMFQDFGSKRANFSGTNCGTQDNSSVWDVGDLDTVALTCTWYNDGDVKEADTRINTTDLNFTSDGASSSCSDKYDVQSVATHEIGHIFGLADVTGDTHANLTMYGTGQKCSNKKRTPGAGDILGMRSLY
jgi:hypothetical protein